MIDETKVLAGDETVNALMREAFLSTLERGKLKLDRLQTYQSMQLAATVGGQVGSHGKSIIALCKTIKLNHAKPADAFRVVALKRVEKIEHSVALARYFFETAESLPNANYRFAIAAYNNYERMGDILDLAVSTTLATEERIEPYREMHKALKRYAPMPDFSSNY